MAGAAVALSMALPGVAQEGQEASKAPVVAVEVLEPSVVADSQQFNGRVQAEDKVNLLARSSGFVQARNFDEGGSVSKGDVLFEIEPDAYQAAVTQIQGQIQSAQAEEKLAQIEVDRQQTLFDRGTSAENVLQQAQAQLGKVQGTLTELQGALQEAQLNLSYTKIIAPFDGRVGFTDFSVGAFVGPESGGLVTLSSVDPMYVVFPVAEARVLNMRKNAGDSPLTAQLTLANGDVYDKPGKIITSDATVNQGTDTLLVRAEFENPDKLLLDGQLVRIQLSSTKGKPVLSFPLQSLQRDQEGYFVMLVNSDNKVEKRPIKVDRFTGTRVVPSDGLEAGDKLITQGLQRVRPGMTVQPQAVPASTSAATTTAKPVGDGSGDSTAPASGDSAAPADSDG